jgi:dTDP-4-amino-4,6-dideoxygalactose transaminase
MDGVVSLEPPFIPFAQPSISQLEIDAVTECMRSGWLTSGVQVRQFEREFAAFVGSDHAVAVSSATIGALLIFEALNLRPGDEIIVPAWTFSGPAMMAHKLGARVVLCDVDPETLNMTPEALKRVITPRTRMVMPTHFAGRSCNMPALARIASNHGLWLVDDAAHALPTRDRNGRFVGAQGAHATFFSFYATKTLTTGDGGMVTTDNPRLAERLRQFRLHGMSQDVADRYTNPKTSWHYDIVVGGWKANMTDMAAALGLAQLHRQHVLLRARQDIATYYCDRLQSLGNCLDLPEAVAGHSWHLYPIRLKPPMLAETFIPRMAAHGVQCSVHFIPLNRHSFWAEHASDPTLCPEATRMHGRVVSLPIYPGMTAAQLDQVISAVRASVEG